ncbi:hypothetical protein CEE36_02980 [candidate division TA06 bacterium B3_TA06]|uniref:HMA domain-containing protein n=1 Tax=candidate division TA06 bacterium B3_TA06 TaxID=2012487 RepID=A0A532V8X3_UNCT6|nr:MAG: hypothetical protein CEE36_02980 [candidate division TA06 bacterium B3_TA06]
MPRPPAFGGMRLQPGSRSKRPSPRSAIHLRNRYMEKKIVKIPAIGGHYSLIEMRNELAKLEGVKDVKVDITTKQARFIWEAPATWEKIKERISAIGYPPQE